jgi:hypothetical protein
MGHPLLFPFERKLLLETDEEMNSGMPLHFVS